MYLYTAAIAGFFYPLVCGAIAESFRRHMIVRILAIIAALLPLLAFLFWAVLSGAGRVFDGIAIVSVVTLAWGLLFWAGQRIGRPIAEFFAEQREAGEVSRLEEKFR